MKLKWISEKNKSGIIALAVIAALLLFTYILPAAFSFIRELILIIAVTGGLLILWKLLSQVENLNQELTRINKTLVEKSSTRQPVCSDCGKELTFEVNFCPDCGADQRSLPVQSK